MLELDKAQRTAPLQAVLCALNVSNGAYNGLYNSPKNRGTAVVIKDVTDGNKIKGLITRATSGSDVKNQFGTNQTCLTIVGGDSLGLNLSESAWINLYNQEEWSVNRTINQGRFNAIFLDGSGSAQIRCKKEDGTQVMERGSDVGLFDSTGRYSGIWSNWSRTPNFINSTRIVRKYSQQAFVIECSAGCIFLFRNAGDCIR
ncbi:hypothetical protein JJQ72_11550 [Paenibacillus sp. F411]|uniref:hypothetical protein n=1 Tax=Paenibacillus sp. F411 TaxID=2820239 RepID=UPI001AAF23B8|nr:hypothetical protein [Paenibacillus sp. F411]MBO2944604.1 hypothetical protein [Paenibacillus sp. F411]